MLRLWRLRSPPRPLSWGDFETSPSRRPSSVSGPTEKKACRSNFPERRFRAATLRPAHARRHQPRVTDM